LDDNGKYLTEKNEEKNEYKRGQGKIKRNELIIQNNKYIKNE